MDTKDTDKKKKYRYYIVELSHPINKDEKFIYVPESWVVDNVDGSTTIIRYPKGVTEAVLEKMKSDMRDLKDNTFDGWATMVVNVKHVTNTKEFAKNYTKKFNKGEHNMLFQNTNSEKPSYGTSTFSFKETSRKPEPIKSSQMVKNNEYETFKATSSLGIEALLIEAISNHLSIADSDREKNNKVNADETASFTEMPTKYNATRNYSHFSTDLKKIPTTSDKSHTQNDLLMNISQDISDHDFRKSVEYKNINRNHLPTYHYTPEFTNNPLKMKFLRKPAKPANTITLKELLVGSSGEKTATTENSTAENLSQELKYHLTKDILKFQISVDKQGPSIHINYLDKKLLTRYNTKESSSVDIEMNAESKYNDKNKLNDEEDQSKIINEAYLNFAYLKNLNALRLRLNNIFEDLTHLDVAKVRSEMKERFKKLDNFYNQYSEQPVVMSSQEPTPMVLEEKDVDELEIEPERDSEKIQIAVNEIVHKKEAQLTEHKITKTGKKNAILPKNYDKNDSKWTLRYLKKGEGLVELEKGSGVYVSGRILFDCKSSSKDSREFARRLLLEVFSVRALSSCCLYGVKKNGEKMATKLGLNAHAIQVLFAAVENHARERNWEPLNTRREIKIHRRKVEMTIRNKINSLRRRINGLQFQFQEQSGSFMTRRFR